MSKLTSTDCALATKSRLFICAISCSPPGTMGGNTKITVEMARCLAPTRETHVFLPQYKLPTFTGNLPPNHKVALHPLDDFPGNDKYHPVTLTRWYASRVRKLFESLNVGPDDVVFDCSDFHGDVLPIFQLQRKFGFRWIPSVFLFVPFIVENLRRGYRFPPLKYVVYWFYQRALFVLMKRRATGFVVTNESDFARFPKRFRDGRLFPYYGGVNVEQLPAAASAKSRDVVFCSRLHPQKGIDDFLDVWKMVRQQLPTARFSAIGNGDPAYERMLREKAERLGIADSVEWLGYVNNEAKFRIYGEARVFVHPTIFDNNGMVAAEALCAGLPVVMYDLPALRHVYTTGCAKVPYGDKRAFAAAVVSLLADPAKYAATAPTPDQVAALRAHWRWESRAAEFDRWLDSQNLMAIRE